MTQEISSQSYVALRDEFLAALDWIRSLDLKIENARHEQYLRALDLAIAAVENPSLPLDEPLTVNCLYEVSALTEIYNARSRVAPLEELKLRIKKILKGPLNYKDEDPDRGTNQPRDYAFELITAANLTRVSEVLLPTKGDLTSARLNIPVECKRIANSTSLHRNVDKALKQLNGRSAGKAVATPGVVAVDVTKTLFPKVKLEQFASLAELRRSVNGWQREMSSWEEWKMPRTTNHLGALCLFSFMAHVREVPFALRCSYWTAIVFSNAPPEYRSRANSFFRELIRTF